MADSSRSVDVAVIGGGITGLTTAHEIRRRRPGTEVMLLESSDHVGGIVGARRIDGHTVDIGPHGFIDNGRDTRALVDSLGIADRLVAATGEAARISMLDAGRLHRIPDSGLELLRTDLLSWRGKARLLAEPFVPREPREESAVAFVRRRFGDEFAERFAVPGVRGVVGGDAAKFSIDGEFPMIKKLERRYGSVLVGAVLNQIERRREDKVATRLPSFREFGLRLKTFRGAGMQVLVDALDARLSERVLRGSPVADLARDGGRWVLSVGGDGGPVVADHVVVATGTDAAASLLRGHHDGLADLLDDLPHPDIRVLTLGYERSAVTVPFPGIGFVAGPSGASALLGAIHASTIFPEQAPPGRHLIRTLAGGRPDSPILSMSQDAAVAAVHDELRDAFGLRANPVFVDDHLWIRPIPTYPVGHRDTVNRYLAELTLVPGLHVAGNSYLGVGVNDCVRDGFRAAVETLGALDGAVGQPAAR